MNNREKETKTKTGKGLARETKILHPARNTASSFQTGNTHCLQKNHWRQEMAEVPQNLSHSRTQCRTKGERWKRKVKTNRLAIKHKIFAYEYMR